MSRTFYKLFCCMLTLEYGGFDVSRTFYKLFCCRLTIEHGGSDACLEHFMNCFVAG